MGIKITVNNNLKDKISEKIKDELNNKLLELYWNVVPLTPVGKSIRGRTEKNKLVLAGKARTRKGHTGGLLRKSWHMRQAEIKNGCVIAYLYNNTHYAAHVNFGHRTRYGIGKARPKANAKKYVKGQHFIERALEQIGINPAVINTNYKGGKK